MLPGEHRPAREPLVPRGEIELHARDMTATFAADVTLGAAQARLAAIDQWLPIDGDPATTLGDLILFDSTGPLRLGYGAWRDLLLGAQFTTGREELISAGGRTVKNVAGYDLTKFIVGSGGVFGRVVTLTTRTYRRPHGALLARHRPDPRIVSVLLPTALRPQWMLLTPDALLCGYVGDERTIAHYRATLVRTAAMEVQERSVGDDVGDRARRWRADGALTCRAAVPPSRVPEFARSLGDRGWIADPAFGVVLGSNLSQQEIPALQAAATSLGGSVRVLARGTGGTSLVSVSTNPVERQIIERLKLAFDPDGRLNPLPWQTR